MWFEFQTAKTVTHNYTDRLVLRGEQVKALQRVVATSVYADPTAGLPLTETTAYDAEFARSIVGLPTAVPVLPTDDPEDAEPAHPWAHGHTDEAVMPF